MTTIPLREAELVSYLQGCGPVGEWVAPLTSQISEDLRLSRAHVCQLVNGLVRRGFIELNYICIKRREYRVLIRLETPGVDVIDRKERSEMAKERMRQMALRRATKQRKRPLIRYAGYEKMEAAQW